MEMCDIEIIDIGKLGCLEHEDLYKFYYNFNNQFEFLEPDFKKAVVGLVKSPYRLGKSLFFHEWDTETGTLSNRASNYVLHWAYFGCLYGQEPANSVVVQRICVSLKIDLWTPPQIQDPWYGDFKQFKYWFMPGESAALGKFYGKQLRKRNIYPKPTGTEIFDDEMASYYELTFADIVKNEPSDQCDSVSSSISERDHHILTQECGDNIVNIKKEFPECID